MSTIHLHVVPDTLKFLDGSMYEGEWKESGGKKVRHGKLEGRHDEMNMCNVQVGASTAGVWSIM